jgi:hypothetical protein
MSKKFEELREAMDPERREKNRAEAEKELAELDAETGYVDLPDPDLCGPPWIMFCDEGKPIAIMPAGRPGDVADVRDIPEATVERIVACANAKERGAYTRMEEVSRELESVARVLIDAREKDDEDEQPFEQYCSFCGATGVNLHTSERASICFSCAKQSFEALREVPA